MEYDMNRIGKRILWGIILLSFHINVGVVIILPEFIGWYMITNSLEKLLPKEIGEDVRIEFKKAVKVGLVLIGYTFITWVLAFGGPNITQYTMFLFPFVMILEVVLFYFVFHGLAAMEPEQRDYYEKNLMVYLILMIFAGVGAWYGSVKDSGYTIACGIILIIIRLWIAGLIRSFFTKQGEKEEAIWDAVDEDDTI